MRWVVLVLLAGCIPPGSDEDTGPSVTFDAVVPGDDVGRQLADVPLTPDEGAADDGVDAASQDGGGEDGAVVDLGPDVEPDGPPGPPAPACDDGVDNDGDGRFDLGDSDCSSEADPTERGEDPVTGCFNGLDDDDDGRIDFPNDPGCRSAGDDDEEDLPPARTPACANGEDDDGDGHIDFPDDPGCQGRGDGLEDDPDRTPECANGEDDDGNGTIDHPNDPGCASAADREEASPCGAADVIDLNGHLRVNDAYVGDLTNAPAEIVGGCGGAAGGEVVFAYRIEQTLDRIVFSTRHPETEAPVVMYLRADCLGPDLQCDRGAGEDNGVDLVIEAPAPGLYFVVVDTGSRNRVGQFKLTVDAVEPPHCRNGVDDDEDDLVDAADPGCVDFEDPDEEDPEVLPACADGEDNDGDGDVDYPDDDDCLTAGGPREAPICALEAPVVRFGQAGGNEPVPMLNGFGATQGSCIGAIGPELVVAIDLDDPSDVHVTVTMGEEPAAAVGLHARTDCVDVETEIACRGQGGELDLFGVDRGWIYVIVERGAVPPAAPLTVHVEIVSLIGECNDEVDNDRDGAIDLADIGCVDLRDDDEGDPDDIPACADEVDNDEDGATDWPDDEGCSGAGDDDEDFACAGRLIGQDCVGCGVAAEHFREISPGLWACVNSVNILTYDENFSMCADGFTPATFDLVNALALAIPTVQQDLDFFAWYRALPVQGDTNYIRTGQKRRGGCVLDAHGDLYIRNGVGPNRAGDGWMDLFRGGGSCALPTGSANNLSHALVGVVCVEGEYVPPHM